jgi:D-alanyl-lipoteichoic acid acyltransferase DltB (MBOAT superfamily)
MADIASPIFDAVSSGGQPVFLESWVGALAYTLQLYFDFSAYSDMAIGLSLMFNVRLPLNFNSPYKATSIIEFWRRWHMTLSRFLRDYLYIPLGGSRHGKSRRYINLMATM